MTRARVLFVAALTPMRDGGHGGQMAAARLIAKSKLREQVEFVPLSSTMESIPPPPVWERARAAARRSATFGRLIGGVDAALVFAADGLSVVEKGSMCMMARLAGRGVVVRFSSGDLPAQCEANPVLRACLRLALRSAHVIVSQGPTWTRYFGSFPEGAGKVLEIPNGVTLGPLSEPEPGRVRIAFVGWMYREKGIFELLEAADRVRRRVPHVRFELIGGGRDLDEFRAEVARRGLELWVDARGWLPHEATLARLRAADIFVLPTHFEGLPNAMLEAMAAGLPVVVTAVGSIPDVVQDGINGLIIPVRDPEAIEAALERLIADPESARSLGRRARQTVEDRYDAERVWVRYAEALERACREAGRDVVISAGAGASA